MKFDKSKLWHRNAPKQCAHGLATASSRGEQRSMSVFYEDKERKREEREGR
jgi:hypothetical protein